MNYSFRNMTAALALAGMGITAQADVVVNVGDSYNGAAFYGSSVNWDYSPNMLDAFNAMLVTSTAIPPATFSYQAEYFEEFDDYFITQSRLTAPVKALGINDAGHIASLYTTGGVTWTTPRLTGVSRGGSLSISNLNIDLSNKRIYASITGDFAGAAYGTAAPTGGALTTVDNFYLWDINEVSGNTAWPTFYGDMSNGVPGISFSGLSLTQGGRNHLVSALRLQGVGILLIDAIQTEGFGTIATPVPEVSSVAMATSGIALMLLMARRRSDRGQALKTA